MAKKMLYYYRVRNYGNTNFPKCGGDLASTGVGKLRLHARDVVGP